MQWVPFVPARMRAGWEAFASESAQVRLLAEHRSLLAPDCGLQKPSQVHGGIVRFTPAGREPLPPAGAALCELPTSGAGHAPVWQSHPENSHCAAVMFDLCSEPARKTLLERAASSGKPSAADELLFLVEGLGTPAGLLVTPVTLPAVVGFIVILF